jgi:hypothetical protein
MSALTRALADFAKLVEQFEKFGVSFVSVTQQFNTTTSMGRLTLNVLLSFAQFEREVTGERIRDKIAASKKKGMWMGGTVPLRYTVQDRKLVVNEAEAASVRTIFNEFLRLGSVHSLQGWPRENNICSRAGNQFFCGPLYTVLRNPHYLGLIKQLGGIDGVSPRFIRLQMKLVQLSPQSIENLMTRPESLPLSLNDLLVSIPMDWREQSFGQPTRSASTANQ